MLTHSCQSCPVAGYTRATSREDPTPLRPGIRPETLEGRGAWQGRMLGSSHFFFPQLPFPERQGPLAQTPKSKKKKWTLQNTFSLTLRSPSVKPPNSSPVPDKSASPLRLLPYPCIMTGVLTMDKSHILSFLQPITDCALPILLYLLWGILFCWLGFVVVLFGGRGKSESHT